MTITMAHHAKLVTPLSYNTVIFSPPSSTIHRHDRNLTMMYPFEDGKHDSPVNIHNLQLPQRFRAPKTPPYHEGVVGLKHKLDRDKRKEW